MIMKLRDEMIDRIRRAEKNNQKHVIREMSKFRIDRLKAREILEDLQKRGDVVCRNGRVYIIDKRRY